MLAIASFLLLQTVGTLGDRPTDGSGPATSCGDPLVTSSSVGPAATAGTTWEETDWSEASQYALASSVDTNSSIGDVLLEAETCSTSVDIYVADCCNNRVVRTRLDGTGWTTIGRPGTGVGEFSGPAAITLDNSTDRLYVCDDTNHRIVMTGMDGSGWSTLGQAGTGEGEFHNPRGIDLDPAAGDLYIADLHNARIVRTRIDGSGWTSNEVDFEVPKGVKYDASSGLVYVTDIDVVVRMRMDGTDREVFDPVESGAGPVGRLSGIDMDPGTGLIYMVDSSLDHIVRTRFDGSGWTTFGTSGDDVGQFSFPQGLRFDPVSGFVYVADTGNNRVVRTRLDGSGWETLGTLGDGAGQFDYPLDVEVDRSHRPRFAPAGELVSRPRDCLGPPLFHGIEWNATLPPGTSVAFQVRTSPTLEGLTDEDFLGPDGSPSTRYTDPGTTIWSGHEGDRWVQYRVVLATSNTTETPTLHHVSVGYNTPPTILSAGVSPGEGDITTCFNFTLRFDDTDGDQPESARVRIDGGDHDLSRHFVRDPHFPGTTLWYETRLSAGEHTYNFSVSDGQLWCHTGMMVLTVHHGPAHSITVTPGEVTVTADEVVAFHATVHDEAGQVLADAVEWSISGGGTIDGTGTFEARRVGTWTVHANASGVSGVAIVEVVAGALASITVVPDEAVLTTDEELMFSAVGRDADGNEVPVEPVWGILGGGTIDGTGRFEATTVGEWPVLAQEGDVLGEALVRVEPGELDRAVVTPGTTVMTADELLRFTAIGYDADGNPVEISPTWSVDGGGTIDQDGEFIAVQVGEWRIEVRASGRTGGSTVIVEPGELCLLFVLPGDLELNVSETFSFSVEGYDADGNRVVTAPRWSVDGGGHVSDGGVFTATKEGSWLLCATQGEVSSQSAITVLPLAGGEDPTGTEPILTNTLAMLVLAGLVIIVVAVVLRRTVLS